MTRKHQLRMFSSSGKVLWQHAGRERRTLHVEAVLCIKFEFKTVVCNLAGRGVVYQCADIAPPSLPAMP